MSCRASQRSGLLIRFRLRTVPSVRTAAAAAAAPALVRGVLISRCAGVAVLVSVEARVVRLPRRLLSLARRHELLDQAVELMREVIVELGVVFLQTLLKRRQRRSVFGQTNEKLREVLVAQALVVVLQLRGHLADHVEAPQRLHLEGAEGEKAREPSTQSSALFFEIISNYNIL
eukprot:scaffold1272_cov250-Pinguiococcus_pyrenoidosus.AAC.24